jgi:hypothetical protein
MALPTDANIDLLLCDAVRRTPDGKLDIAGFFPVHEVKLDSNVPLPVAINITFVLVIKDGEGRFKGVFRLEDPLNRELHRQELEEFAKAATAPHVVMLQINRIPVERSGNFTVVLEIGGREYRRPVRIFQ